MLTVIYNDDCSKCVGVAQILEQSGKVWEPIRYLQGELTSEVLNAVFDGYSGGVLDLIRTNEAAWRGANPPLDVDNLKAFVLENPSVLQRPLVLKDGKTTIARPPEVLLTILQD